MKSVIVSGVIAVALLWSNEIFSLALLCIGTAYGLYKLFETMADNKIN